MMPLRIVVTSAVAAAFLSLSTPVHGADLPREARESKDAGSLKSSIDTYVKSQIDKIVNNDPKSGVAREELASQSDLKGQIPPSASFNLVYVESVKSGIQELLKNEDAAIRLNGAIVIYRLAVATQSSGLQPVIEQLMNDAAPAVQLWGVKAAGVLLPTLYSTNMTRDQEKLSAGIVATVKKNPGLGAMVQEAYKAFDLSAIPAALPEALQRGTDRMNEVLAYRVQQYAAGMPADPQSERMPPLYLIKGVVTKASTPKQKTETMQNLVDLLYVSAQRTVTAAGPDRARLQSVASSVAGAIRVLVVGTKDASAPFSNLANAQPAAVQTAMVAVVNEIKKMPEYSAIKDPPVVKPLDQSAVTGG